MKRWIGELGKSGEAPEVDAFIADIVEVCNKHGMWLSHEDQNGAFEIDTESTEYRLSVAHDMRKVGRL